ncbi:MAG: hypothetical protein A3G42_06465 [Gammaproteobacteria bacterium RIFCSPLOWO2_12_FULL_47_76]|nr:MAG: hypothetical protein A3G42_06465 [Gammaproteobacteria bacterium RIFCSPLOWO2_12_FULL_47_76]
MPLKLPNVAHYESGRVSLLVLPSAICPKWFKKDLEVMFVPLYWKDDLQLSDTRIMEAILICSVEEPRDPDDWNISPASVQVDESVKPELQKYAFFIYKSKLAYNSRQYKLNCPPMIKGICDQHKRVFTTEHSLGVCLWSHQAFSEHFGKIY